MPPVESQNAPSAPLDFDRHYRRAVWITMAIVIVGAAVVYADKAAEDRSAFIRWRPQVLAFWAGENIYDRMMFPNPPIMPITLYPLMTLPPVQGALAWYFLKAGLAAFSVWCCFRMARDGDRPIPSYVQAAVLALSFRPILGDLHHGNNNLVILALIVATLMAWRKHYDVLAGLLLALAIAYKVTPALFVPYFMYKRSWRTVGATFLGLGLFLVIVPSLIIGPQFNGECLGTWFHRILRPFVVKGVVSKQEINQSLVGVLTRLLTESEIGTDRYDVKFDVNLVSWPPRLVGYLVKGVCLALVGALAFFCRTRTDRRDDPRLLGEFALVVLTMLFVSERSWKHHFVTILLPYTYLAYRAGVASGPPRLRRGLAAALVASAVLMGTTSSEIGGLFADGDGHEIAQGYGMFLWAAVVLYVATAWRVWSEREAQPTRDASPNHGPPVPHYPKARAAVAD